MQAEEGIITVDGVHTIGVFEEKLLLDIGHPQKTDVENTVGHEARQVQGQEIKAETNDTFPSPVLDHLWVKGDRPRHEVDPANHLVYDANDSAVYHQEPDPGAGLVGMISMQKNSHLSNILRSHLERGIFLSARHYNFIRKLHNSQIF